MNSHLLGYFCFLALVHQSVQLKCYDCVSLKIKEGDTENATASACLYDIDKTPDTVCQGDGAFCGKLDWEETKGSDTVYSVVRRCVTKEVCSKDVRDAFPEFPKGLDITMAGNCNKCDVDLCNLATSINVSIAALFLSAFLVALYST